MSPTHLPTSPRPGTAGSRTVATLAIGLVAALLPAVGSSASTLPTTPSTTTLSGAVVAAPVAAEPRGERRTTGKKRFWRFVASEQFDRLDPARWGRFDGTPGCCPDAEWDPSMVKVRNGKLQLHTAPRGGRWLSGGVGGWDWAQGARTHGRWDARIRFDRGTGVSAAALLWPSDNSWPPELDFYEIFETWGGRQRMAMTTHWQADGQHQQSQRRVSGDFTRWHVASVRWMPGRVAYYLDGRLVKVERSRARIPKAKMWVGFQTHAHRIDGRYAALPEGRSSIALAVDWVRVYQRSRG